MLELCPPDTVPPEAAILEVCPPEADSLAALDSEPVLRHPANENKIKVNKDIIRINFFFILSSPFLIKVNYGLKPSVLADGD